MFQITLKNQNYLEIIKLVKEKEKAGYIHITPIRKVHKPGLISRKEQIHTTSDRLKNTYAEITDNFFYMCVMRKASEC